MHFHKSGHHLSFVIVHAAQMSQVQEFGWNILLFINHYQHIFFGLMPNLESALSISTVKFQLKIFVILTYILISFTINNLFDGHNNF